MTSDEADTIAKFIRKLHRICQNSSCSACPIQDDYRDCLMAAHSNWPENQLNNLIQAVNETEVDE